MAGRLKKSGLGVLLVMAAIVTHTRIHTVTIQSGSVLTDPGPCTVSNQSVVIGTDLDTHIYYPEDRECNGRMAAPYPAVAFAHGFSGFGLSDGAGENAGHGEHLASWGYVVAIPTLPDGFDERFAALQDVLSYMQAATVDPDSFLYEGVDDERLATVGYSLGGASALALAARDARVKAVVALDPVYHQGPPIPGFGTMSWDPEVEGPNITVPTCIQGAPPSNCNSYADHSEIYPFIGSHHKATFLVVDASHCDFSEPGHSMCDLMCDGSSDAARTALVLKYITAWLNYYLYLDTESYAVLYGTEAEADIVAGRIKRQVANAPRDLSTVGTTSTIKLQWSVYGHPIVAGYSIYRRIPGESYSMTPYAQTGKTGIFTDTSVIADQVYSYTLNSRDPADNPHQASVEISANATTTLTITRRLFLPVIYAEPSTTTGYFFGQSFSVQPDRHNMLGIAP
jgi:dienelactone hydrolase